MTHHQSEANAETRRDVSLTAGAQTVTPVSEDATSTISAEITRNVNLMIRDQAVTTVSEDATSTTTAVLVKVKPAGTTPTNLTDMNVMVSVINNFGPVQKNDNLISTLPSVGFE